MQFSDVGGKQGLIQDIDFICGTTSASYPLADKTRNLNQAYHDVTRLIWESADKWQYDDSNAASLPIIYTTLTHNTQGYNIPSTAQKIHRIEIKDGTGNWNKLDPFDIKDIDIGMPEYLETAGLPVYYDLMGDYITLYPKPSSAHVTLASGMAVYVDRDVTLFTTASTTAQPGFAPQFHRILSITAALDFEKDPQQRQLFLLLKQRLEEGIKKFYSSRETESRVEIKPKAKRQWRQYL